MDYELTDNPTIDSALINAHMALMVTTGKKFAKDIVAADISRVITNMAHLATNKGFNVTEVIESAATTYVKESNDAAQKLTGGAPSGHSEDASKA